METVARRKALGRKSDQKGDGKVSSGSSKNKKVLTRKMGRAEVDEKVSLRSPKALVKDGLEKNIGNSSEGSVQAILGVNLDILALGGQDETWAAWVANFEETPEATSPEPKRKGSFEEWERRREERMKADLEMIGSDYEAWKAGEFRHDWNAIWSGTCGSFEDITRIPPMRFTYKPAPDHIAHPMDTVQVFSAKVAATRGDLQWPLDVFGMVAIRDNIDHNRNIIFYRSRDNCQTLTTEDPNLVLVGPTRAVVSLMPHPITMEVDLKVKGTTNSEDQDLSFLAMSLLCGKEWYSRLLNCAYTSKLSTLEFTLGCIVCSVEATVFVRITRGSWPDGFYCQFAAFTTGIHGKKFTCSKNDSSIDREKIVLLDSRGEKVSVAGDGTINLSRSVVSVEDRGELKISVKAWKVDNSIVEEKMVFTPLKAGLSKDTLDIGFCKMEVIVGWSLVSSEPVRTWSVL